MNILDFIKALKVTYRQLNSDKIHAKSLIEDMEKFHLRLGVADYALRSAERDISFFYGILPINVRREQLQPFLDSLNLRFWSPNDSEHRHEFNGYLKELDNVVSHIGDYVTKAKSAFHKRNYSEVTNIHSNLMDYLSESFYEMNVIAYRSPELVRRLTYLNVFKQIESR